MLILIHMQLQQQFTSGRAMKTDDYLRPIRLRNSDDDASHDDFLQGIGFGNFNYDVINQEEAYYCKIMLFK